MKTSFGVRGSPRVEKRAQQSKRPKRRRYDTVADLTG